MNNNTGKGKLSDQDMLTDILCTEKQMMETYNMSITESSCPNMRSVLSGIYGQTAQDQLHTFEQMKSRGWYQTKDAQDQDVQQAKQKMEQVRAQLG